MFFWLHILVMFIAPDTRLKSIPKTFKAVTPCGITKQLPTWKAVYSWGLLTPVSIVPVGHSHQAPLLSSPSLFYYFFPLKNVHITFHHPHFFIVCVDSPLSPQVSLGWLLQGRAFFPPLYQVLTMHLTLTPCGSTAWVLGQSEEFDCSTSFLQ